MDYRKEIVIDPLDLENECLGQGMKMLDIAQEYADACGRRERAKTHVRVVRANLALQVRKNPKNFGLEKATDKTVADVVDCHQDVETVENILSDEVRECELLKIAVETFKDRSIEVGRIIYLQRSNLGYGSEVKVPSDYHEGIADRGSQSQREGLKSNPRLNRKENTE